MTGRLDGQRAVVTGAASGLGRGIAAAYGAEGARVALLDVDADGLRETAAGIDGETLELRCDVRETDDVEDAMDRVVAAWDGVDVVVNNAGVIVPKTLRETTDEELERMVDVNLNGGLRVARAAVPALERSEGTLINMSSITSVEGSTKRSVYGATKGGLKTLTHQLAVELAPAVRVNAIAPGTIKTPLNEDRRRGDGDYLERKREKIPLDRLGEPEEVAGAAVFLASDEAAYVTGHVLFVDGGRAVS